MSHLVPLLAGVMTTLALFAFANGLFGTLIALYAVDLHLSHSVSGVVIAAFSVGFMASTFVTPGWVARLGHRLLLFLFTLGLVVAAMAHPFITTAPVWIPVRMITGLCVAGIVITTDSWINLVTHNAVRGRVVGLGVAMQWIAYGVSQSFLMLEFSWKQGFWSVAALFCLLPVPLLFSRPPLSAPGVAMLARPALGLLWHALPLSLLAAFANGLINTAFLGMLAMWGWEMGWDRSSVAMGTAGILLVGGVLQWPFAWLSDRFSRRGSLLLSLALAVGAGLLLARTQAGESWVMVLATLFGAFSLQIYPVAVALANDRVTGERMVAVSAALNLVNGLGMMAGPVLAGVVLERHGAVGLDWVVTLLLLTLALFLVWEMRPKNRLIRVPGIDA